MDFLFFSFCLVKCWFLIKYRFLFYEYIFSRNLLMVRVIYLCFINIILYRYFLLFEFNGFKVFCRVLLFGFFFIVMWRILFLYVLFDVFLFDMIIELFDISDSFLLLFSFWLFLFFFFINSFMFFLLFIIIKLYFGLYLRRWLISS